MLLLTPQKRCALPKESMNESMNESMMDGDNKPELSL